MADHPVARTVRSSGPQDRFGWLEYPRDDFPYYAGVPVRLSAGQWTFVLAAVALGFAALVTPVPMFATRLGRLVPAILFPALPLAALALVAGEHWKALFRRLRFRDFLWMIAFAVLNFLAALAVGSLVLKLFGATRNQSIASLAERSGPEQVLFFARTIPQLFGEEVVTLLPFLALLALLARHSTLSRRSIIVWAWILSALLFGALHLPTYDWNFVQCALVIGTARLILTLPYIKTKNILVSAGTHVLNDWVTFALSILTAGRVGGG